MVADGWQSVKCPQQCRAPPWAMLPTAASTGAQEPVPLPWPLLCLSLAFRVSLLLLPQAAGEAGAGRGGDAGQEGLCCGARALEVAVRAQGVKECATLEPHAHQQLCWGSGRSQLESETRRQDEAVPSPADAHAPSMPCGCLCCL